MMISFCWWCQVKTPPVFVPPKLPAPWPSERWPAAARSARGGERGGRVQYRAERRDMSTDIAREESFRTALRNQKRRLSATEKKPVSAEFGPGKCWWCLVVSGVTEIWLNPGVNKSVLGGLKTRDSLTPPRRDLLTPPRATLTPPRSVQDRGAC